MLPGVEHAAVEPAKITDYLLSNVHPVGRFKAVVLFALGYTAEEWELLRDNLLELARTAAAVPGQASEYSQKYEVSGLLRGPLGHLAAKASSQRSGWFPLKAVRRGLSQRSWGETCTSF